MRYVALVISAFLLSSAAVGLVEAGDLLFASGGVSPGDHNCPYPPCPHPPSVPQNLQATPGDTQVTLSWTAPLYPGGSAIINYKVYRGTAPGTAIHVADAGTSLSHLDTGLVNGQPYYYQVSAVNADMGEGSRSPEVSATPAAPTAPSAPQSLQATPGDAQVALSWLAPADLGGAPIVNYKVYRGTAPGTAIHVADAGTSTSHVDTNVVNGQPYYYQVSGVNTAGEGPLSAEVLATPTAGAADTVSPTISITSPTPGEELDSTSVAVTGTATDSVGVEKVELSVDGVRWTPAVGIDPWSGTLTLVEGQNTIRARAIDTSGNPATATVTVTVTLGAGGQFSPDPMILGIIAVVAAGAVAGVVALVLARRRKPRVGEGGRQS